MERIHVTSVSIKGRAVLISGSSGSGKSDLALRLIGSGAILVSDDYTEISAQGGLLYAAPPLTIAGRMEVRGQGIIRRPYVSGIPVALMFDLTKNVERLPEPRTALLEDIPIPVLALNPFEESAVMRAISALRNLAAQIPART